MAIAVTVTAFRRGDSWAWWALLVGNTIAFVSAMTYDRITNAIGLFELSEYLGLVTIYGALTITAPFLAAAWPLQPTRSLPRTGKSLANSAPSGRKYYRHAIARAVSTPPSDGTSRLYAYITPRRRSPPSSATDLA